MRRRAMSVFLAVVVCVFLFLVPLLHPVFLVLPTSGNLYFLCSIRTPSSCCCCCCCSCCLCQHIIKLSNYSLYCEQSMYIHAYICMYNVHAYVSVSVPVYRLKYVMLFLEVPLSLCCAFFVLFHAK